MGTAIMDTDHWKSHDILQRSGINGLGWLIASAIAEERERCAKVAERLNGWGTSPSPELAEHIAKVIRQG